MNNELAKQLKDMTPDDFYKIINSDGNNEIKDWRTMGFTEEWIRNKLIEIVDKTSKQ